MSHPRFHWMLCASLAIALPACRAREDPAAIAAAASALRAALEARTPPFFAAPGDEGKRVWEEARRFYERTGYRLA